MKHCPFIDDLSDDVPINSMVDLPIAGPNTDDLRPQCCTSDGKKRLFDPLFFFRNKNDGKMGC